MVPTAAVLLITGDVYYPYSWAVRLLAGFSAGVLLYLSVRSVPRTAAVRRRAGRLAGGAVLAIVGGLWLGATEVGNQLGGVVIVLFPVLIGAVALAEGGRSRLLRSRWAVHGGRMSYSLYLVHIPIFELAWSAMLFFPALRPDSPAGLFLAALALVGAFGAGHLLYRFVEEPARRRLRELAGQRAGAPTSTGSYRRRLAGQLAAR
jgi:peptidoglycan/LPS O-acetylase OafA/YrhL